MTTEEIISKITSRNTYKVWESSCKIIEFGQNSEKIIELIPFLSLIKEKTMNLDMGGMFASNQRFIDFAVKTIEFHKLNNQCNCQLYIEKFKMTNDIVDRQLTHDGFNPRKESERGNIKILDTIYIENKWIDFYIVECEKSKTKYKVEERDGHYMFWNWEKYD